MSFKKDLRDLFQFHYISNILLCLSFVGLKTIYPVCQFLFPTSKCELDWREWEILTFLAIVIIFRSRRSGSTSMLSYLSASFIYCKLANLVLFFYADPRMGLCYGVLCLLHLLVLPEPAYTGPENIVYFRGPNFMDEINQDRHVSWLITFYTAWSPACVKFAPIFAELSGQYHLDNLKFGKVDVAKYPVIAKDFHINDSSFSKQLPTVILFKNGKEHMRRPAWDSQRRYVKFFFTEDNVKAAFDLNNLHMECKKLLQKKQKGKELKNETEAENTDKVKAD